MQGWQTRVGMTFAHPIFQYNTQTSIFNEWNIPISKYDFTKNLDWSAWHTHLDLQPLHNNSNIVDQRMIDWFLVTVFISSTSTLEGQLQHRQGSTHHHQWDILLSDGVWVLETRDLSFENFHWGKCGFDESWMRFFFISFYLICNLWRFFIVRSIP